MSDELATLDAIAQADLVARGEVTSRELVEAAIERIERLNPKLNAVITPTFERALEHVGTTGAEGPLRGVPFLMKDLDACVAGEPFHCGMAFLKNRRFTADHDAYLTKKFRDMGLISVGKTNTPELGLTVTTEPAAYGPTRNPWNTKYSSGGSSGGAAAAVASGMVPVAHASDGGGSIRIPASECGLVGLKPSRGRVSLGPDYGEYWAGFVTSLVVSRSVRDTALVLDCVHGSMPGDPYTAPVPQRPYVDEVGVESRGLRVGLMTTLPGGEKPHAACVRAVERAAEGLQQAGHHIEYSHPAALDEMAETTHNFTIVVASWVAAALDEWGALVGQAVPSDEVEPSTWALAEVGRTMPASVYVGALKWVGTYTRRMAAWWDDGFDVLVTPTLGAPPPPIGYLAAPEGDPLGNMEKLLSLIPYTPPFNMTGQPAISLPLYWTDDDLPVGVQLVGAYGREDLLLGVAAQLEHILPWHERRPRVFA